MSPASGTHTAGRPIRLPRSARRKQLLEAAQEVFVAQGYHAAAMDDIAERAGVSKPVLYQHFPGKLDLYLALLDTHCDAIIEKMRTAMSSSADNKMRVAGAISAYFDFVDHESEAFRLVFESDLRNDIAGRHVVVCEGVVDSGRSLTFLIDLLKQRNPASIKVATLLDKVPCRKIPVPVDYAGWAIGDEFVIGYGMDYAEKYRNLPYVGVLEEA